MIRDLICINCPRGCHLKVDDETLEVTGNFCLRGKNYGISEVTAPKRTITSTVKVVDGTIDRCSIKTAAPIDKNKIFEAMELINKVEVKAPVKMHQVIIENILESGVDVIATKEVEKR